jgi:hypothetical protein
VSTPKFEVLEQAEDAEIDATVLPIQRRRRPSVRALAIALPKSQSMGGGPDEGRNRQSQWA